MCLCAFFTLIDYLLRPAAIIFHTACTHVEKNMFDGYNKRKTYFFVVLTVCMRSVAVFRITKVCLFVVSKQKNH